MRAAYGHGFPSARLDVDLLLVVQVGLEPVPHVGRWQCKPEEHEAETADVGRVAMVEQADHLQRGVACPHTMQYRAVQYLLFGKFEGVELEEEAEAGGDDAAGRDSAHPATHPGLAWTRRYTPASNDGTYCGPRFSWSRWPRARDDQPCSRSGQRSRGTSSSRTAQPANAIYKRPQTSNVIKSGHLEVGAALYVGEDERVEVHGPLVPVEGQLAASPARRVIANTGCNI